MCKEQLASFKKQVASLRKKLEEVRKLKDQAEKARDEAEQHGYDVGVAETEDALRAEVPAVC